MDEGWSASVEADEGEDGLFAPVLILGAPDGEPMRVPLASVYKTKEAGREAVKAMSAD